jgi:hypothetical protein
LLQPRQFTLDLVLRRTPGGFVGIDVGEIPLVLVGNLGAIALLRDALYRQRNDRGEDHERPG